MSDDESPMPRKIEEQMLDAIREEKDFTLRNTRVEVIDFPGIPKRVNVYLYSKCICKLTEDELETIRAQVESFQPLEGDLRRQVSMDIKRKMDIGCYQGRRHRQGLPVRGQSTKTNARTRKGKRKTKNK